MVAAVEKAVYKVHEFRNNMKDCSQDNWKLILFSAGSASSGEHVDQRVIADAKSVHKHRVKLHFWYEE